MPESIVEGNFLWDEWGAPHEQRWSSDDVSDGARQIKRGARVAERFNSDHVVWVSDLSDDVRASARAARAWLEARYRDKPPVSFALYAQPHSEDLIVVVFVRC